MTHDSRKRGLHKNLKLNVEHKTQVPYMTIKDVSKFYVKKGMKDNWLRFLGGF